MSMEPLYVHSSGNEWAPPMLQWLRQQDPPCAWDEDTCAGAAEYGHLHIIQWVRQQIPPCPWNHSTCGWAAHNGDLPTLQWLRQQQPPCPWDEDTLSYAVERRHNHILRWVHKNGYPLDEEYSTEFMQKAAFDGDLGALDWAQSQHLPFTMDETLCVEAASNGQIDVLQWLRHQHPPCPWDEQSCRHAALHGSCDTLKWLRTQVPPCPWNPATQLWAANAMFIDKILVSCGLPKELAIMIRDIVMLDVKYKLLVF